MSSRHHPLVIDEGASAEVVARVEGHLVGDGILRTGVAPDDLVIVISGESDLSKDREKPAQQAVGGCSLSPVAASCYLGSFISTVMGDQPGSAPSRQGITGLSSLCVLAGQ